MSARRQGTLWYLTAGYVALLPYQFRVERSFNFAPADIFMLLVVLLAAGQLKYRREQWSFWHFAIPMVLAVGSLVASLRFGNLARYEFLNKDAGLVLPLLSYTAAASASTDWLTLRGLLRVFVVGVVIENMVAVAGYFAGYYFGVSTPFTQYAGMRLSGMLTDPNAYGGLLVVALVIAETATWGESPLFGRRMLWVARITLILGILFTFSRSGWVALTAAMTLLAVVRTGVVARLAAAVLAGIPLLLLVMGRSFVPFFEEMASRPEQVQGRFDLIDQALAAFARHPLPGGGLGSFRLGAGEVAHNSAMWFLADFGVVGLVVLLGFLGWFFVRGWMAYRLAPAAERPVVLSLLAAHAAMCGLAMGIEAFYQRQWWLIFGWIAAAHSLALQPARRTRRHEFEVSAYAHST